MFRHLLLAGLTITALACKGEQGPGEARGRGLSVAQLSPAEQARVYRAAVSSAFDLGPGLVLLMHPRLLPREAGTEGGEAVPEPVIRAMRQAGTIAGTCEPVAPSRDALPRCEAQSAGYVIRYSPVLALNGDSVQVYLSAEQYTVPGAPPQQMLRFEKAYQIVKRGGSWRVVREGRVPRAVSGIN